MNKLSLGFLFLFFGTFAFSTPTYEEGDFYFNLDTNAIYLGLDSHIRWITDEPTFQSLFVSTPASAMTQIHNTDIGESGLPLGLQIPSGAQLLNQVSGAFYLSDLDVNSVVVKRHITSEDEITLYHFDMTKAITLSNFTLSGIPDGVSI